MYKIIKLLTPIVIFVFIFPSCEKNNMTEENISVFTAELNGSSAVPSNASKAKGTVILTYDKMTKKFAANITYNGLMPNAGHIHIAQKEENGNVVIPFREIVYIPTNLDGNQVEKEGGGLSKKGSPGTASTQKLLSNPFDKANPSSPVTLQSNTSTGSKQSMSEDGLGNTSKKDALEAYSTQKMLISIAFEKGNLISPVILRSNELTDEQIKALFEGRLYVDLHTNAYPDGEIRGQLQKQ